MFFWCCCSSRAGDHSGAESRGGSAQPGGIRLLLPYSDVYHMSVIFRTFATFFFPLNAINGFKLIVKQFPFMKPLLFLHPIYNLYVFYFQCLFQCVWSCSDECSAATQEWFFMFSASPGDCRLWPSAPTGAARQDYSPWRVQWLLPPLWRQEVCGQGLQVVSPHPVLRFLCAGASATWKIENWTPEGTRWVYFLSFFFFFISESSPRSKDAGDLVLS